MHNDRTLWSAHPSSEFALETEWVDVLATRSDTCDALKFNLRSLCLLFERPLNSDYIGRLVDCLIMEKVLTIHVISHDLQNLREEFDSLHSLTSMPEPASQVAIGYLNHGHCRQCPRIDAISITLELWLAI